ncbi:MAG: 50S ribosomal protein L21 [Candidatus Marinimicrobia bacterium]|nr:50S ribosomal protein L21 [Candidatus Neomarinimicrobiota bacterium]MBP00217.1 50S ribosomal protein L21 [Candidatus Neomarinimicrobiota bacterium]MEC7622023.1 50S ribosomal protein L21 [Candidatus Neomarinimicrobiota bacterium]MEC7902351.1 50S ribosomal protein L21 [Candidatus Neomarinimicrobiota bacterium]MED5248100.1 50S ribosomal protein L21 [Candidatus Neomarinimicrobiota bacterium]
MFAIINIAGKQFRVEEGDQIKVPHLSTDAGKSLAFDKVLLVNDGKKVQLGSPLLSNASISATVVEHGRGRKIRIFKKKRRKGYRRNNGHRQNYSLIKIDSISTTSKKKSTKKTKEKTSKKED